MPGKFTSIGNERGEGFQPLRVEAILASSFEGGTPSPRRLGYMEVAYARGMYQRGSRVETGGEERSL